MVLQCRDCGSKNIDMTEDWCGSPHCIKRMGKKNLCFCNPLYKKVHRMWVHEKLAVKEW